MKRQSIDYHTASLAATFYEPVYQRLQQFHNGEERHLLCFVRPTSATTQNLLQECGAVPSQQLRVKCFAEIWELSHPDLLAGRFRTEPRQLDQAISATLGCHNAQYSAATGLVQWAQQREPIEHRQRLESRLLREASLPRGRRY